MRRWLLTGAGVAAAVLAIDTALWLYATHRISQEVDFWTAELKDQGWIVTGDDRAAEGWPFAASLAIAAPSISGGEGAMPGGLAWRADRVVLSLSLAHPATLSIAPQGHEELRVSHVQPIAFWADSVDAAIPLGGGRPDHLDFRAHGVSGGILGSRHPQDVQVEKLAAHLRVLPMPDKRFGASLDVSVAGLQLPDIGRWPLGATLAFIGGTIDLSSPDLSVLTQDAQAHLAARQQAQIWRDGGGKVSVRALSVHWGPVTVSGGAELGLDGRLQPEGTGTAEVTGAAAALDALSGSGVILPGLAETAKAVLGVMAHVSVFRGGSVDRLPFVLRDSTLSIGQIPLVRLNDIKWADLHTP